MEWKEFDGKKVYIEIDTNSGLRKYQGTIEEVTYVGKNTDSIEVYFLLLVDKYGMKIGFNSSSINLIQEER